MDKGRHPKVIRTWLTDKVRKVTSRARRMAAMPHKPQPHNKT